MLIKRLLINKIVTSIFTLALLFSTGQRTYSQNIVDNVADLQQEEEAISQKAFEFQRRSEAGKAGLEPDQLSQELAKAIDTARQKQQNNATINRYWQTEGSQSSQKARQQQEDFDIAKSQEPHWPDIY